VKSIRLARHNFKHPFQMVQF